MGEGYVCIANAPRDNPRRGFRQKFFHWPVQRQELLTYVDLKARDSNLWYSVNLFDKPERLKEYAQPHNIVWADLDTCSPTKITPAPSLVIISSPGRFQALWKVDQNLPPDVAEDYSKRIAYLYRNDGADPTGWDLTQLLRVPFSKNLKYEDSPEIIVGRDILTEPYSVMQFEELEMAPVTEEEVEDEDMPELHKLPDPEKVIYKYQSYINRSLVELIEVEPDTNHDWSARMWKLLNLGFEAGMEKEEIFSLAIVAKCNKYKRDRRPMRYLWREVLKAHIVQQKISGMTEHWEPLLMPELVEVGSTTTTFIDDYFEWASTATDAVPEFHRLTGAIMLSAVLADAIRIPTSYATHGIAPNLWGLVLGDSTLTRKTTAMEMAKSIIYEVDKDLLLASDGSAEGLLTGLSERPHRTSVFHKDEVSGFFESINSKQYLSGMKETLTELYDCPPHYARLLRKEIITVNSPVFIFFGGGITDQVFSALSEQYVLSGFLPRFLVVIGSADIDRLRMTGPPIPSELEKRQKIVNRLVDARARFFPLGQHGTIKVAGTELKMDGLPPSHINAKLTGDAWKRYGEMESHMVLTANDSYYSGLALPTFERLSRSILKLSSLLAAMEQDPTGGEFTVTEQDVVNAAGYVQAWGRHSIEVIVNAGITQNMRLVGRAKSAIERKPGILSSNLMRLLHLSSREMKDLIQTLEDRGEVEVKRQGRGAALWPIV